VSGFKGMFSSSQSGSDPTKRPIPPEEDAVLEKVAKKVVQWRMAVPAILFLESIKPLNYISAQAMVFFEPIVQAVFSIRDYDTFRQALERRENIENLLQKIEAHDAVAHKKEKLYKKKLKTERKKWKWYQRWLGIKQPRIEIDPAELEAMDKKDKGKKDDKTGNKRNS
jgi:ASC-1-like (ASCH) protein